MHREKGNTPEKLKIDQLTGQFFDLFTNTNGTQLNLDKIHDLFIPQGIIIKNINSQPDIYTLETFIEPRKRMLTNGTLTNFKEEELSETTTIKGTVAQRFSLYKKSGVLSGNRFETQGVKVIQFIKTQEGWRISALAWDDEAK